MNHCRSFLKGLKWGLFAAPVLGITSVTIFLQVRPFVVQSEIGPFPAMFTETFFWFPVSTSVGALIGAIIDARRDRERSQFITVFLLLMLAVPILLIWGAMWFVSLVGIEWLQTHGLYFRLR